MGIQNILNMEFTNQDDIKSNTKQQDKKIKKISGLRAKRQGDNFEAYFTKILKQIEAMDNSPIIAFRKHSNEIVRTLAKIGRFDLIAKLGYKKGDLDYSITLKSGYTVYAECKSGDSPLSKEQKELIAKYKQFNIPYFLFTEKDKRNLKYIKATYDFKQDIDNMLKKLNNIEFEVPIYTPF